MASASHFSGLEATGFGFGFQIMILEATGFGFGFLNFKMEATGFGFGLGFLSPSWLRLRLRSHQPGFQPNPGQEGTELSGGHREKEGADSPSCCSGQSVSFFERDGRHSRYPMGIG